MIVQLPVPPAVVHGFAVVNEPGPQSIVKLICVPFGAFTKPPVPVFTFTCAVKTWLTPTGFVAVCGVIWMFASTNVLTASPEFGATPSVCDGERRRARDGQRRRRVRRHLAGRGEVKTIVHWPARVRVRTGVVAGARRGVQRRGRTVRVRQREVDVLARAGDEARARVLLQGDGEGVRLADLVRRVGAIEIFAVDPRLRRRARSSRPTPFVCRVSETPPTDSVECALTIVVPATSRAQVDRAAAGPAGGRARVRGRGTRPGRSRS